MCEWFFKSLLKDTSCFSCSSEVLLSLLHQGSQAPRHRSSHRTLKALTSTLTLCLATTPMPITWILQVTVVPHPRVLCCHLRVGDRDCRFIVSPQVYRRSECCTLICLCVVNVNCGCFDCIPNRAFMIYVPMNLVFLFIWQS